MLINDEHTPFKNLVLHIGFHKTATTTIQHYLYSNARLLRRHGVLYPHAGRGGESHGFLANLLKPENNRLNEGKKYWGKVLREFKVSGAHTAILSSECFLESRGLPAVLCNLPCEFDLKLIVYLRRQDHWIQSVFNEVVADPMRRHVGKIKDLREYRQNWLKYDEVIREWEPLVGIERIIVRPFERGQFFRNNIRADFMNALGLETALDAISTPLDDYQNPSMPPVYIEFLRRCNLVPMLYDQHMQLAKELRRMAVDKAGNTVNDYNWLSGSDRRQLVEAFDVCNQNLVERYCSPEKKLFHEPWPEVSSEVTGSEILTPHLQHQIFDSLSRKSRKLLEENSTAIRSREKGKWFLRKPCEQDVPRLRELIMRQRHELRMLYRKIGTID